MGQLTYIPNEIWAGMTHVSSRMNPLILRLFSTFTLAMWSCKQLLLWRCDTEPLCGVQIPWSISQTHHQFTQVRNQIFLSHRDLGIFCNTKLKLSWANCVFRKRAEIKKSIKEYNSLELIQYLRWTRTV